MRILLDTNILLISISDRSAYHWIFQALINNKFELCVSNEILNEYEEIIEQHMGVLVSESVLGLLDNLSNVKFYTSYFKFNLITKDPDDNKFVDCAIASNADFIVTNDRDFKALEGISFPKVNVLSLVQFELDFKDELIK
jgi:putative PIN family toxin of toxin-antitoxin system